MSDQPYRLRMAQYNRQTAHAYRRFAKTFGNPPPELFYWHMKEAIRWVQVEKYWRVKDGKAA